MDNPEKLTREVTQWLAEIAALRQQLADAQQAIADTEASAEHWRQLYNTEAEQRRREAEAARERIDRLQAELDRRSDRPLVLDAETRNRAEEDIARLTPDALQEKYVEACLQRDRLQGQVAELIEALEAEKADRAKTRADLTSALADAVELLAKAKDARGDTGDRSLDIQP
ncbi:hypothetical protein [Baaleninema simplex]|uniref:hypothetical protein n=1 Tax=Baaleninema simplex TaxID=2862350 RepID=UPI000348FF32|nr:hypothetical protein [Baaleninema simplex]